MDLSGCRWGRGPKRFCSKPKNMYLENGFPCLILGSYQSTLMVMHLRTGEQTLIGRLQHETDQFIEALVEKPKKLIYHR